MYFSRETMVEILADKWLELHPEYELVAYRTPKDGEEILNLTYGGFELLVADSRVSDYHVVKKKVQLEKGQLVRLYNAHYGYQLYGFFVEYLDEPDPVYVIGNRLFDGGSIGDYSYHTASYHEITPLDQEDVFPESE